MSSNDASVGPVADSLAFRSEPDPTMVKASTRKAMIVGLCFVVIAGIFLRLSPAMFVGQDAPLHALAAFHPNPKFNGVGYDENLYRVYVDKLTHYGLTAYPDLADGYISVQKRLPGAILPPTRFIYVFCGYLWKSIFGGDSLAALHNVSSVFSILLLLLSACFAWRLGGWVMALSVTALMAAAPTQIHMSQHALIDGVFAFWAVLALWLLWENLQHPDKAGWLVSYAIALAVMVLTKENAMFAYVGFVLILGLNRWLRLGTITNSLLGVSIAGPLAGVVGLVFLCGGADTFYQVYRLLVSKASVLPYAIATGDGPWYRYLIDLLLVSPIIFILAWGAIFRLKGTDKPAIFLLLFVAGSYLIMCNVRYGMNLRYTNMWDLPLRYLAVLCVFDLVQSIRWRSDVLIGGAITFLCLFDLRQYRIFFVEHNLYELVSGGLLHALRILK